MTPPIRFLFLVLGGWTLARVFAHLPGGDSPLVTPAAAETRSLVTSPLPTTLRSAMTLARRASGPIRRIAPDPLPDRPPEAKRRFAMSVEMSASSESGPILVQAVAPAMPIAQPRLLDAAQPAFAAPGPTVAPMPAQATSRLSGSAWMLARGGNEVAVANNGLLGGSQTGARLLYRVNDDVSRPLSISARISSPLRRHGVEAAAGVEWQPLAGVPVRILAERRQRIAGEGRSAFALLAHGGVSDRRIAGDFRFDAYAQAGVVGAASRDLFADAGVSLVRPLDPGRSAGLAVGAGAWGGAQPGAARLDIGPRITTSLEAAGRRARLSLDWRFRVAGASAPASGPSLTVGTDF